MPFTRDFSLTEPEEFARGFLGERLGASELVLGAHFAFGRGKRGDLALLQRLGPECGFAAEGVDEVIVGGEPVSSTRIREALAARRRGAARASCSGASTRWTGSWRAATGWAARSATRRSTWLPKTSSSRPTGST